MKQTEQSIGRGYWANEDRLQTQGVTETIEFSARSWQHPNQLSTWQ